MNKHTEFITKKICNFKVLGLMYHGTTKAFSFVFYVIFSLFPSHFFSSSLPLPPEEYTSGGKFLSLSWFWLVFDLKEMTDTYLVMGIDSSRFQIYIQNIRARRVLRYHLMYVQWFEWSGRMVPRLLTGSCFPTGCRCNSNPAN